MTQPRSSDRIASTSSATAPVSSPGRSAGVSRSLELRRALLTGGVERLRRPPTTIPTASAAVIADSTSSGRRDGAGTGSAR